jgi:ABC-type multidrug transport system permease subunit
MEGLGILAATGVYILFFGFIIIIFFVLPLAVVVGAIFFIVKALQKNNKTD